MSALYKLSDAAKTLVEIVAEIRWAFKHG